MIRYSPIEFVNRPADGYVECPLYSPGKLRTRDSVQSDGDLCTPISTSKLAKAHNRFRNLFPP
jgi:hypothetical protein